MVRADIMVSMSVCVCVCVTRPIVRMARMRIVFSASAMCGQFVYMCLARPLLLSYFPAFGLLLPRSLPALRVLYVLWLFALFPLP